MSFFEALFGTLSGGAVTAAGNYITTTAGTTPLGPYYTQPMYVQAAQAAVEPKPCKIEVPVYDVDSREGILLRDKNGKLHYVPIEKIAQVVGESW